MAGASFGERLRSFRKRKGMTQGRLAKAIGAELGSVSRWERMQRMPGGEFLIRLAQVFPDLDLSWLLMGTVEAPSTDGNGASAGEPRLHPSHPSGRLNPSALVQPGTRDDGEGEPFLDVILL